MSLFWSSDNASGSKIIQLDTMECVARVFQPNVETRHESNYHKDRKKQKRYRSAFTTTQVALLEAEFKKNPYVTTVQRQQVASAVGLHERSVKIWFQNRRMKEKRDSGKTNDSDKSGEPPAKIRREMSPEIDKKDSSKNSIMSIENNCESQSQSDSDDIVSESDTSRPTTFVPMGTDLRMEKGKDLSRKLVLPTERNLHEQKQPVGHILPFCQVTAPPPQRSPENLTVSSKNVEKSNPMEDKVELRPSLQPTGYHPLDLTNYYAAVPAMGQVAWNRYNFIPMVSPGVQNVPSLVTDTPPALATSTKCTCNCHRVNTLEGPRYQAPYPLFYTQYVPHIVASTIPPPPAQQTQAENNK